MITVLGLVFGLLLLGGVFFLVMKSGVTGRKGQSSSAVAAKQQEMNNPRGDVRSGNGPD